MRLRGFFPEDKEPGEIPVQENTSAWHSDPIRLTRDSLKAATKGIDTISTPAGRLKARHLVYKTGQGLGEWWLSDEVPGGMVKYQITSSESKEDSEKDMYGAQLTAFGSGAKSRLQSF